MNLNDDNLNPNIPDFTGVPGLDDDQGLQAYLNNESLKAIGLGNQGQATVEQPAAQPAAPVQQPAVPGAIQQPAQPAGAPATGYATKEDIQQILQHLDEVNRAQQQRVANPLQPQQPRQSFAAQPQGYTAQEQQFIGAAIAKGYGLDQINATIVAQRNKVQNNPLLNPNTDVNKRIDALEQLIATQEYKQAEAAFISRLSDFGNKFGLSEQDLVAFGQKALSYGINIAQVNDLETAFRGVYPEQYAIRVRRMSNTPTSQIYGGAALPDGGRAAAAKAEDAYVDNFMKQSMPNLYNNVKTGGK